MNHLVYIFDFTRQVFRLTFWYEEMVLGGCNYTPNSRFAIVYNIKMHFGNIKFSTARERPLTTGACGQLCSKAAQFLDFS